MKSDRPLCRVPVLARGPVRRRGPPRKRPVSAVEPRPWQAACFHPHRSPMVFFGPCHTSLSFWKTHSFLVKRAWEEIWNSHDYLGVKFDFSKLSVTRREDMPKFPARGNILRGRGENTTSSLSYRALLGPVIATIEKWPALQGCWKTVKTGLVFETTSKIVSPRPKQVFPEHPRNRSGKSLSPPLESKFLIFSVSGVSPSTNGHSYK